MMQEAIRNFSKQLDFVPTVENGQKLLGVNKFVVVGMGGSHLAADLLKMRYPELDIIVHSDYGLPSVLAGYGADRLVILSSYSGNTEEVLEAFEAALSRNLPMAAISVGGKLQEFAQGHGIPYIQMPNTNIQPRLALGFSLIALMKLAGKEDEIAELNQLGRFLDKPQLEQQGMELAARLKDAVPIIYASSRNAAIAYNWKIKFNETAKIPAFYNVFPELNHNEMTGFDVIANTKQLSNKFYFLFLKDKTDYGRTVNRMDTCRRLYEDRGMKTFEISLAGTSFWDAVFGSLLLADWTALYLAEAYGAEPEQVPMVEEFKRLIQ